MLININSNELTQLLEITPASENIMLCGKHGIGKSEIITNFFEAKGMKVVPLFLGQMSDPGDLIGLPDRDSVNSKTRFLPPFWFPSDDKPIVLFLDELNRARPEVLQSIMDLALNRTIAGRKLPKGSRVISAVNYGDEYQLTDLDPALVSRFNVYCFKPTASEWLLWAKKNGIDERVINFIQENKLELECDAKSKNDDDLEKSPDRRGWVRVSFLIKNISELTSIHHKAISGIIGAKATAKFIQFISANRLPSPHSILYDFDSVESKLKHCNLSELSSINESLFRYFETEACRNEIEINVYKYVHLLAENNREAFAHWMSFITEQKYPAANAFLFNHCKSAMELCNQFLEHWNGL